MNRPRNGFLLAALLLLVAGTYSQTKKVVAPKKSSGAEGTVTFTDYRGQRPGVVHKITVADLPAPQASESADNAPSLVPRPSDAWPQAPTGFKVELYASGLDNPRLIRTAPNGDFFVAESRSGEVKAFRGIGREARPSAWKSLPRGSGSPLASLSILLERTRNGCMSPIPIRLCALPIGMAT